MNSNKLQLFAQIMAAYCDNNKEQISSLWTKYGDL